MKYLLYLKKNWTFLFIKMIERYSRKEVKQIWEDQNRYKIWLEIELAAAASNGKI